MKSTEFTIDMPGELVSIEGGEAFVPAPLPPKINLQLRIIKLLVEAERAMGELSGMGRRLPNPHLLIGPFLHREAILSSRIEGTHATAKELVLFEAMPQSLSTADVKEVANYVQAIKHGLARLKELPVCLRLIKELHEILLKGVRGDQHRPGEFRDEQNLIGEQGQSPVQARFVPPPHKDMTEALYALEKYMATPTDIPVLIQLALIHYQFETIHPFMDGNGRIGRLLTTLLLCERGCLPYPLLYLSAYFERNRDAYMDALLFVTQRGSWEDWIIFFLRGVLEQAKDAIARTERLCRLWDDYRRRLQSARSSGLSLQLVDKLFEYPVITVPQAEKWLQVTTHTAQNNIDKLVKSGIIVETTGQKRNRLYIAPEIVESIEAENYQ